MSAEAEKVISLSLCKMAESRTTRRGGTSLHKHLLIASVLTKATRARSAILDTWYMGDDAAEENINLNMSYQEADFPTEELDSTVGESSVLDINASIDEPAISGVEGDSVNANNVTGSRDSSCDLHYVAEVESEIDLPPDILNCVEKLSDLNNRIFSTSQPCTSSSSVNNNSQPLKNSTTYALPCSTSSTATITSVNASPQQSPSISQVAGNLNEDTHISDTLTYLDLDAGSPTVVARGPLATSTPLKRRREWCYEDDDDDKDDILDHHHHSHKESSKFYIETPVKSKANDKSTFSKSYKRLRFDHEEDSGVSSPDKSKEEKGVPSQRAGPDGNTFKNGSFRLTYEDEDGDDSDDDSFLEDALNQDLQSPSQIQIVKTRHRNDRRVPSRSSSSGSCSDEDGDEGEGSMEVDQITNLVQFISFNKQQSQPQNAANMQSISCVT